VENDNCKAVHAMHAGLNPSRLWRHPNMMDKKCQLETVTVLQ
jgi:hypothetical protein